MSVRLIALGFCLLAAPVHAQGAAARPARAIGNPDPRTGQTEKPPLHARHWLAITGKPLSASAGAQIFAKGGNAVDAAAAMLAAGCTMWDTLSCGGETQALIYNPHTGKVIGLNALGVAPTGATKEFYRSKGYAFPPEYGPLAAVTPGTVGGLLTMMAEWGKLSLADVLAPAIQMADGYPIEAQLTNTIERNKKWIKQWKYAPQIMLTHQGSAREAPEAGEIFVQKDLAATWRKLVETEKQARRAGKSRKAAIYAAYDRFYKGDIARELVRGVQEDGGLFTMQDLANWKVRIEEPLHTNYRGIEVYKLPIWQQGPAMLQALNILENADLKTMGYNTPKYLHTIYQAMSLAFADRDFYYGDPYFPPDEPVRGLLSKDYAKKRFAQIDWTKNDPTIKPGDPYPFQGGANPLTAQLAGWNIAAFAPRDSTRSGQQDRAIPVTPRDSAFLETFHSGTTSIESADEEGWVVSVTPSGGWVPAVIAGRTGIGLSQRAQSFVTAESDGPFNVIEPGKLPRVTLTPTLAMKDGKPYLAFAVQGGDSQDQNLLQFFLDVVEFGMTVQQAVEAPNINSDQLYLSLGGTKMEDRKPKPGYILLNENTPDYIRKDLRKMGYTLSFEERTSGPINAIYFDWKHNSLWGGSSNHGEDYGIGW